MKKCIECGDAFEGRVDKIYCSEYCKSSFHYKKNREKSESMFQRIDRQLKVNRRLLSHYNAAGKSVIRKEDLLEAGFNPKYFTHYWKNQKKEVYLFCYEFGFLELKDNNKPKYLLIHWQDYMNKSI